MSAIPKGKRQKAAIKATLDHDVVVKVASATNGNAQDTVAHVNGNTPPASAAPSSPGVTSTASRVA